MSRSTIAALAVSVGIAIASSAAARDVKVGTTALNLKPPSGFCELDAARAADQRLLATVAGLLGQTNRLLMMAAECGQLEAWRTGKRQLLADFVQFQTLSSLQDQPLPLPPKQFIGQVCTMMKASGQQWATEAQKTVEARAKAMIAEVTLNENRVIDVVEGPGDVCYATMVQKIKAETGAEVIQVGMTAVLTLRDKLVYYYRFSPFVDEKGFATALARHRSDVGRIEAENAR